MACFDLTIIATYPLPLPDTAASYFIPFDNTLTDIALL